MLEIILILKGVEKLLIKILILEKKSLKNPGNKSVSYVND
jgi:hypothetical protein